MKNLLRLVLLALVIALGFWAWNILFPNPQKVIRHRLEKLAKLASCSAGEGNFSRVASVEQMGSYFTDNAEVTVDIPGVESHTFNGRAELVQAAMAVRATANGVSAELVDINIDMGPNNQSAMVDLTLKARVGGERDAVIQELEFTFKKIKGDWLISRVATVQTLKR